MIRRWRGPPSHHSRCGGRGLRTVGAALTEPTDSILQPPILTQEAHEHGGALVIRVGLDIDLNEAAVGDGLKIGLANRGVRIRSLRVTRGNTWSRVLAMNGSAAEFLDAGRVNGVILPVPVAIHDEGRIGKLMRAKKLEETEALDFEAPRGSLIGAYPGVIRTHDRGRADDQFEISVTGQ